MTKYVGLYETFEQPVVSTDLIQLKEHIENSAGYEGNAEKDVFKNYETAWIMEFVNGVFVAQHYFSMIDKRWYRAMVRI